MRTSGQFSRWGPGTPASSPGGGFSPAPPRAAGREGVLPNASMAHVSAPTPPGRTARWQGNADLRPVLPVGAGTAARSAANGVYHAAVRMMLNARVPAESRTTPELGVLPCRPPPAGCAGPHRENCPEVGVPLPGAIWTVARGGCIFTAAAGRRSLACCAMRRISSTRFRGAAGPRCRPSPGGGLEIGRPGLARRLP